MGKQGRKDMGRDTLTDPILSALNTMRYEYINGQSKGGQLIIRPKDRLLRQLEELREIVKNSS